MLIEQIVKETEQKEEFMLETANKIKEMHHSFNQLVIQSNILKQGIEMLKEQEVDHKNNDEERKS